ncbi:hypothetical protein GWK47_011027 [Chionoecetes opilio]|uniref:Uncharacterized protein n=1 Tax=Chionoecetes opilio TaxID=41210 RepID=A0A8J4Y0T9_CHIOP|nr:hypothetical protein GWK47_011027 [Chionoecetes opilio]
MWQVKFASRKTQLLNVSRSGAALRLKFNGDTLTPQDEVEVLRVTYDRSLEILFKAQVRSSLEYACLALDGAANKHLALLNKVQARAVRIIEDSNAGQEPHLTTLQHHRDVAGLTVVFKVQVKRVSHLQALWQPCRLAPVTNRAVALAPGCWNPGPHSARTRSLPGHNSRSLTRKPRRCLTRRHEYKCRP